MPARRALSTAGLPLSRGDRLCRSSSSNGRVRAHLPRAVGLPRSTGWFAPACSTSGASRIFSATASALPFGAACELLVRSSYGLHTPRAFRLVGRHRRSEPRASLVTSKVHRAASPPRSVAASHCPSPRHRRSRGECVRSAPLCFRRLAPSDARHFPSTSEAMSRRAWLGLLGRRFGTPSVGRILDVSSRQRPHDPV